MGGAAVRAQVSLEFIIVSGMAVTILLAVFIVAYTQVRDARSDATLTQLADIAASIEQELLAAQSIGAGYERVFVLPTQVQKQTYTVTLASEANSSVVTVQHGLQAISARTPRCTGTLSPGRNELRVSESGIGCNS